MRVLTRIGSIFVLLLGGLSPALLATDICGPLAGTLIQSDSPFRVTCNISVGAADTLSIDPAVQLRFTAGTGLTVDGELLAFGTDIEPILITSDVAGPAPGDWTGIEINGTGVLDWVTVQYGEGIVVNGSLDVDNSEFKFNGGLSDPPAITFGPGSIGSVANTEFDQNAEPLFLATDTDPALSNLTINLNHTFINGVEVMGGAWTISRTWTDPGAPYLFNSTPVFDAGTQQILEAGVILKLVAPDSLSFQDLVALGTNPQPVIVTSIWDDAAGGDTFPGPVTLPAAGDWGDLTIRGAGQLDHFQVRYGGRTSLQGSSLISECLFFSNLGGITVQLDAEFANCLFELNQNEPAITYGISTTGSVSDSLFDANYHPILLARDSDPAFSNLTINTNHTFLNGVQVVGGLWTIDRTWNDPSVPYAPDSSLVFAAGTVQTVEPGVIFKMFPTGPPTDSLTFNDLVALGTAAEPIVFTSMGDTFHGGDTFPGGVPGPAEGDWGPLEVNGTADFDSVTVRYGTSIELLDTASIVTSRILSNSLAMNVHTLAAISDSLFIGNGQIAATDPALTFQPGAAGTVDSSIFSLNYIPITLGIDANPDLSALTILDTHSLLNGVQLAGGAWTIDRTWTNVGVPYMPDNSIQFAPGTTQTIEPGVIFKFIPFGGGPIALTFGNLDAVGTVAEPIVFTSTQDLSIAPDALIGFPGAPATGDWEGLIVAPGGTYKMTHARVSWAVGGVTVDTASGSVDLSRFTDNKRGIDLISGGFARVTSTDFISNALAVGLDATSTGDLGNLSDLDPLNDGLNSFTCNTLHIENLNAATLRAENNWWDDDPPDPLLLVGPIDILPFLGATPRPVIQTLMASVINAGADVLLEWPDLAPLCSYRVFRSTQPDTGFADISGPLGTNSFTDVGAGTAPPDLYYYRVLVE